MAKAKKKNTPQVSVSQEENVQVQQALEHYHQLAVTLYASDKQEEVEAALTEINTLPEGVQLALVKELSKEKHVDAADVLAAINELAPLKNVRKEAKRSLIRLEASRIYPRWKPPTNHVPIISAVADLAANRRFWKGVVTDSLDMGEVQLLLCWEQGTDYRDVRVLGFLLDYSFAGVKDFFTEVESKRSFEKYVARMIEGTPDVKFKDCSLAEGGRLLRNALKINERSGVQPHKDYRFNLSLINELILNAPGRYEVIVQDPDVAGEQEDKWQESVDLHDLKPDEVVAEFIGLWSNLDYERAYDCLSSDSAVRAGLTKDKWAELRAEVEPADFRIDFVSELNAQKPKTWFPSPFQAAPATPDRCEVEAGWSVELEEAPPSGTLPELPEPTTIYEETGRRWFWSRYTLVRENDVWLIQSIADEGANVQKLSVDALQKRIRELEVQLQKSTRGHTTREFMNLEGGAAEQIGEEALLHLLRANYHTDILIKKKPLDRANYATAAGCAFVIAQYERALSYLLPLLERFPEERAPAIRRISELYQRLSNQYFEQGYEERSERFQELAEAALRDSLAIEESFEAHISLAELLIEHEDDESLAEAETHLLQAKATNTEQEAHIELHLGEIANARAQFQEALRHYQRVVELQPTADAWIDLGDVHKELENFTEAETSYKRAIELEPNADDPYYELSQYYAENGQPARATEVLEEGLRANPDSVALLLYAASHALSIEDYSRVYTLLEEAERRDPDSEAAFILRQAAAIQEKLKQMQEVEIKQPKTSRLLVPPSKQKNRKRR